jgi:hypothetical protein
MNETDTNSDLNLAKGGASLRELLARIESGDLNAASEVYKLGQQEKYAAIIYSELKAKTETQRQALYKALANGPEEFRKTLIEVTKKESFAGIRNIIIMSIGVVILLPYTLVGAIENDSILIGLIGAVPSIFMGMFIPVGAKQLKCAKEVKKHLS